MKNRYNASLLLGLTLSVAASACFAARNESAENASTLSKILDGSDTLSQASEFSVEDRGVYVVVDGSDDTARQFCPTVDALVARYGLVFAPGWAVQVMSSQGEAKVVTSCAL